MKKSGIILLHTGYWILYMILISSFLLLIPAGNKDHSLHALGYTLFLSKFTLFAIIPEIAGFYCFYFFLFSGFLQKKRFIALFFAAPLTALACGILATTILTVPVNAEWWAHNGWASVAGITFFISALALLHGIIALVMKGFFTWFGDIKLKEELNRKNYEMELELVKSQINPHFLFNTINNIDVLIETDAPKASAYLKKLSDIMRFMLYETKPDRIMLSKELIHIQKYVELQKIRSSNPGYVNYAVEGNDSNQLIAPMIFIPFIENAFKHAENKKKENAVNIKFMIDEKSVQFYCENKFSANTKSNTEHPGLGNDLMKKRLQLLYPQKHQLHISSENQMYVIKLMVNLNEN
jgi:two-component system, LytTR family, sensor kinase